MPLLRVICWDNAGELRSRICWVLLEPLRHDFMVRALLISALVGGVCGCSPAT